MLEFAIIAQTDPTTESASFFGFLGVACALVFASKIQWSILFCFNFEFLLLDLGAAYGTAKSGVGISSMGVLKPELIIKSIVPVVMAGILGIYGLIVAVILFSKGNDV